VDRAPAEIVRADLYFRAVELAAGEHRVVFAYRPRAVRLGLGLSLAAGLLWTAGLVIAALPIGRGRKSRV
jgi:hypothetical protein